VREREERYLKRECGGWSPACGKKKGGGDVAGLKAKLQKDCNCWGGGKGEGKLGWWGHHPKGEKKRAPTGPS